MLKTVLATSLLLASVLGVDLNIISMTDFETFAGSPSTYDVVYLYTDLDFTDKTVTPIENFQGMLYGNGHVIKGLKMTSNAQNVGIFANMQGSTIKDLIIDSSCEFKGTYADPSSLAEVNVGSVVGKCAGCIFENIINHAAVSYESTGFHPGSVYVGGIAGTFSCESGGYATMKNVANYGTVSNKFMVSYTEKYAGAGGLVGYSLSMSTTQKVQFTNCLSYGEVTTTNTNDNIPDSTGTGGILGVALGYPSFKNVVSAAMCNVQSTAVGSVLGLGISVGTATFENCYATNDVTTKRLMGGVTASFTPVDSEATAFEFTKETFNQLNSEANYANVWVNNADAKAITFQVNGNTPYVTSSKVIIAPVLSSIPPYFFKGWYSDESCETAYTVSEASTADITLHGGWQYTLTYKANGGALDEPEQSSKNVIYMHKIGQLPEVTREGYTFVKWTYENSAEGAEVNADAVFDKLENAVIYAQWSVNKYTITFNFNNGTEPLVKEYDYGATVTYPEDPTRFEHTFLKWVSNQIITTLNNKPMPAKNVTVDATWELNKYEVVFHIYDGRDISYKLGYGTPVTYPSNPTREGYTFMGWDNDAVTTTPSGGVTINAIWSINTYFVTFVFDNGTEPLVIELEYGSPIEYPMNITREGFEFAGWKLSPATMPAYNFTTVAEYHRFIYTVTFIFDNGNQSEYGHYGFNETIVYPEDPVKEGYIFAGWSPNPETMPSHNFETTAQWTIGKYAVTFDFNNGTEPLVVEFECGSPIEYPMNVIREGFSFIGWYPSPATMPAYNLTITAEYATIIYALTFTDGEGGTLAMRSYAFNETIAYPEDPKRSGYTFVGWSPRPATMLSYKLEIRAKWAKSLSTHVEVVLEKGLEKEEAVEMLKGYTQDEFTVEGFDVDAETGEVRVVVTFADKEKAKAFVVSVNGDIYDSQSSKNSLKDVGFVSKSSGSFSLALAPLLFGLILV